jgi:hypothetical protein
MDSTKLVFLFLIVFQFGCNSQNESIQDVCFDKGFSQPVYRASLNDMDKIKELNGNFIEVNGVFTHSFEDVAIYRVGNYGGKNAMWLNLELPDSIPGDHLDKLHGKQVRLIGKVNMSSRGHLSYYFGSLDSVLCIRLRRN